MADSPRPPETPAQCSAGPLGMNGGRWTQTPLKPQNTLQEQTNEKSLSENGQPSLLKAAPIFSVRRFRSVVLGPIFSARFSTLRPAKPALRQRLITYPCDLA